MKYILMILIAGFAAAVFTTEGYAAELFGVDIHGFISQGYLSGTGNDFSRDTKEDDFVFSEAGINFGSQLSENMRFGVQFFAKNFGDMGNNDINLDWAFADYRFYESLGVRIGQIKTPHGLYNDIRDIDMLHNPIFLPNSVYQEISHDLYVQDIYLSIQGISSRDLYLSVQGIGLYGYLDLSRFGGLSYQGVYGTQNIKSEKQNGESQFELFTDLVPNDAISKDSLENDSVKVDHKYAANLVWDSPLDGLRFGASLDNVQLTVISRFTEDIEIEFPLSGGSMQFATAGELAYVDYDKLQNQVYSVEYSWNKLILMAEYMQTVKRYQINFSRYKENKKIEPWGWYAGGSYRFLDWFELGGYYSQTRNDKPESNSFLPAPDFFHEFDDICATLRFDINDYWTFKVEAHSFRGKYALPISGNILDPEYKNFEEYWDLYTAKMTVAF